MQPGYSSNNIIIFSRKRAHYGLFAHPLDFLLRSKTYLKECPPSASIANREFPLSIKVEEMVRLVYTHYKMQIT